MSQFFGYTLSVDDVRRHVQETQEMLLELGLEDMFPFACPSKQDLKSGRAVELSNTQVREASYPVMFHYPPTWLDSLRARTAQVIPQLQLSSNQTSLIQVAVHVRRGDLTPCSRKKAVVERYLPNTYYLKVMDRYLPEYCGEDITRNCQVIIYSQSKSVEDFTPFVERGYQLSLDADVAAVWTHFMQADLVILSESAFSYTPALLNQHGTVIQPQYELPSLPDWKVIPAYSDLRTAATLETQELFRDYCGKS